MKTASVAIVGAGLSGLYAAWLLERRGIRDYVLLEARPTAGGRVMSVPAHETSPAAASGAHRVDRVDLGPTWFWPDYQRELDSLVRQLGLVRFEQFETGDMVVERSPHEAPLRTRGYVNAPASMRLLGGMAALTDGLLDALNPARLVTGQTVQRLRIVKAAVELDALDSDGQITAWRAGHVLLALPPRLAAHDIAFEPALPADLQRQWRATPTWMAPHAKYVAVYDTPFWRGQGLSGEARSALGPLGEVHDASMPGGSAALFGFFGLPGRVRRNVPDSVLREHCRAQLVRLFGPQAQAPRAEFIKDWAQDPCTATAGDLDAVGHHAAAPAAIPAAGPWRDRLTGIASEWSPQFPGYLAGAIESASLAIDARFHSPRA